MHPRWPLHLGAWLLCSSLCLLAAPPASLGVELIGYVPSYRMTNATYVNNVLPRQLALLDEVRYFGITVHSDGSGALTTSSTHLANIQQIRAIIDAMPEAQRPRLDVTLGRWQMSDGVAAIAADPAKRATLASNIEALLDETGAAAVDLDWEHPVGSTQLDNYASLLQRIKAELGGERRVYATVEPSKFLPVRIFSGERAVDGVSLMTYDVGWWANDAADANRGEHSLQKYAEDALNAWTDLPGTQNQRPYAFASWGQDAPEDLLGIGLPLYGRTIGTSQAPQSGAAVAYSDLATMGAASSLGPNYYAYHGQTYWAPGPGVVADRIAFAVARGLNNVILWELFHDLDPDDPSSLLRAAFNTKQSLIPVVGDFDGDRDVDAADYAVWRGTFGLQLDARADGNGDGIVDAADYTLWRRYAMAAAGALASNAVPEPRLSRWFIVLVWQSVTVGMRSG